jgi:hypothetical protein
MKRVVLVLSLAAVVALPSAAFGGLLFPPHNSFQGRVEGDPNTYFGFNLNKKHHAVRHLAVAFPMNCYSGDHAIVHTLFGRAIDFLSSSGKRAPRRPHRHHHGLLALFEGTSRIHTELGRGKLSVLAIVIHRQAEAYLEAETDSAAHGHCYSGVLEAKARKGAEVALPAANP